MPTLSQAHTAAYPCGPARFITSSVSHIWGRSPRVNGKLVLQPNDWSLTKVTAGCTNVHSGGSNPAPIVYVSFRATTNDPLIARARAVAESDLRGELARRVRNKEGGALGVSIATSAQSIAMMKNSAQSLTRIFAAAERFYQSTRGKKRLKRFRRLVSKGAPVTAGMVLEGFFGWAPLLQDFYSAARTLANPWPDKSWYSVKRQYSIGSQNFISRDPTGFYTYVWGWSATGHSTYSCAVQVSNPNLWVANKLGLVNPLGVIWDLVPWSFLVNMVSNMGQVVGSLTDFTGLALTGTSLTTSLSLPEHYSVTYKDPRPGAVSYARGSRTTIVRGRVVGVRPPAVTPYMRFPSWGIGTAAIVGALLVQQTGRLSKALGL